MTAVPMLFDPLDELISKHVKWFEKNVGKRKAELFVDFLKNGYALTTLDSVADEHLIDVLVAKQCLGTLITLIDDLADDSNYMDKELMDAVHQITLQIGQADVLERGEKRGQFNNHLEFAAELVQEINERLEELPKYGEFIELLKFDLNMIVMANHRAYLSTSFKPAANYVESKVYGHHNMGMIAVGMIDLMGSSVVSLNEVGKIREIFFKAQRVGRIFNQVYTLDREIAESDLTNEILLNLELPHSTYISEILKESRNLISSIRKDYSINTFSLRKYSDALVEFEVLHRRLIGKI